MVDGGVVIHLFSRSVVLVWSDDSRNDDDDEQWGYGKAQHRKLEEIRVYAIFCSGGGWYHTLSLTRLR